MNNNRLQIIVNNEISVARKDLDYVATINGGKKCALCQKLYEMGKAARENYLLDDNERENGKVMNRVIIAGHERGVFLCNEHYNNFLYHLSGYCSENDYISGKETKDGITNSFELELSYIDIIGACELTINHDGLMTSDSTVTCEIKSSIMNSLNACTKMLGKIESLIDKGHIAINHTCGTHLHTGLSGNEIDFTRLFGSRNAVVNYIAFFEPIALHISRDYTTEERVNFFGRDFDTWAKRVYFGDNFCRVNGSVYTQGMRGMMDCHVAAFNVQHDYSIEFRLPKYRNAKQYRTIICAMQSVMIELKKAFFNYGCYDITTDNLRMAGNKALSKFRKFFGK